MTDKSPSKKTLKSLKRVKKLSAELKETSDKCQPLYQKVCKLQDKLRGAYDELNRSAHDDGVDYEQLRNLLREGEAEPS